MPTDYTDHDTASAREFERSSAGYQTQPLVAPVLLAAPVQGSRSRSLLGILLIVLGSLLLIGYIIASSSGISGLPTLRLPSRGEITSGLILMTIGSCFLFFAFWRKLYPFLIPGCILAGLSVGVPFAGLTHGASVLWGLSFAFLSILLLSRTLFSWQRAMIWPIIPAVVLFAVGTIIAITNLPSFLLGSIVLLPLLLIVLGLALGRANQKP